MVMKEGEREARNTGIRSVRVGYELSFIARPLYNALQDCYAESIHGNQRSSGCCFFFRYLILVSCIFTGFISLAFSLCRIAFIGFIASSHFSKGLVV